MAQAQAKPRPKNIGLGDISRYRLPLPGRVSILHRVSGVGLFLMLGPLLWLFQASLTSEECFTQAMASPLVKLILAGITWAFMHHFCAGIRFLLLDMHVGTELAAARKSAGAVLIVSLALTVLLWSVWLW